MLRIIFAVSAIALSSCSAMGQQLFAPPVITGQGSSLVVSTQPTTLLTFYANNLTNINGHIIGYNATSVPADGALNPALVLDCINIGANTGNTTNGMAESNDLPGPGTPYNIGLVLFLSTDTSCYVKTTGGMSAFIKAEIKK